MIDARTLRTTAEPFFSHGTARLRFHPTQHLSIVAASPQGALSILDARGGMSEPKEVFVNVDADNGGALSCLDVSSSGQFLVAGDAAGQLHVCVEAETELHDAKANTYSVETVFADEIEQLPPRGLHEPIGDIPLPITDNPEEPLASEWPAKFVGKKGVRTVDADAHLATIEGLKHPNTIAVGSVSGARYPNSINRPRNLALPRVRRKRDPKKQSMTEDNMEPPPPPPEPWGRYRHVRVKLGKFGLHDDFSFEESNETHWLCALDNTVPNCYCNAALIALHQLPWVRVHCLSSLSPNQARAPPPPRPALSPVCSTSTSAAPARRPLPSPVASLRSPTSSASSST